MSGPSADELIDSDPLLNFAEEPGGNQAEIVPVVESVEPQRLDLLEQTIDQTQRDLAQIRSEIATLVGAVEDIKKRNARRSAMSSAAQPPGKPWAGMAATTLGVTLGIVIGALIWMQLGATKPVPVGAAPSEEAAPAPAPADAGPRPDGTPVSPAAPAVAPAAPTREPAPPKARDQQSTIKPSSPERPAPVAYFGSLSIEAVPVGEVFLNREDAGRTPLRVDKLRAGSHLVWIERDGYQRWTRVVEVRADRDTRLSAELEPVAR